VVAGRVAVAKALAVVAGVPSRAAAGFAGGGDNTPRASAGMHGIDDQRTFEKRATMALKNNSP